MDPEAQLEADRKELRAKLARLRRGGADDLDQLDAEIASEPPAAAAAQSRLRALAVIRTLLRARQSARLTQAAVAEAMSTTQSAVSDLERGQSDPRLSTLQRYASAVNMRLDLAVMKPEMPVVEEEMANEVWRLVEGRGLSRILRRLIDRQERSRSATDLAEYASLPSVIADALLARLVAQGWVTETKKGERQYVISPRRGLVIGVAIRTDHIVAALTDLLTNDALVGPLRFDLTNTMPKTVSGAVAYAADQLAESAKEFGGELLGLGVTLAGVVKEGVGSVKSAPDLQAGLADWTTSVPLAGDLHELTGLRVVVGNDANALAIREHMRDAERQGLILILLSATAKGIGAGVVINGALVRGDHDSAGEIGHVSSGGTSQELCRCGSRGCLEKVASEQAVFEALGMVPATNRHDAEVEVEDMVRRGDERALTALTQAGESIGRVLATAVRLLDPARLLIYGPGFLVGESRARKTPARLFLGGVRASLADLPPKSAQFTSCELSDSLECCAAASLVVRDFTAAPLNWVSPMGYSAQR